MTSTNNSLNENDTSRMVPAKDHYPLYIVDRLNLMIPVCVIGIIFNVLNIIVLTRKAMRSSINVILTCLAISDLTCIFFEITVPILIQSVMPSEVPLGYSTYPLAVVSMIDYYVAFWASNTSNWITVIIGTWRCVAVTFPFRAQVWFTSRRAKLAVLVLVFVCAALSCPEVIVYAIRPALGFNSSSVQIYELHYSSFAYANGMLMFTVYQYEYVVIKLVPSIILLFATFVLIWGLCHATKIRRKLSGKLDNFREFDRTTAMMLVILLFFLASNLPYAILILLTLTVGYNLSFQSFEDYCQLAIVMNYIVNFPIYMIMSRTYRNTFLATFFGACPKMNRFLRTPSSAVKTEIDVEGTSLKTAKLSAGVRNVNEKMRA